MKFKSIYMKLIGVYSAITIIVIIIVVILNYRISSDYAFQSTLTSMNDINRNKVMYIEMIRSKYELVSDRIFNDRDIKRVLTYKDEPTFKEKNAEYK